MYKYVYEYIVIYLGNYEYKNNYFSFCVKSFILNFLLREDFVKKSFEFVKIIFILISELVKCIFGRLRRIFY